jgi:hypothetical protein
MGPATGKLKRGKGFDATTYPNTLKLRKGNSLYGDKGKGKNQWVGVALIDTNNYEEIVLGTFHLLTKHTYSTHR